MVFGSQSRSWEPKSISGAKVDLGTQKCFSQPKCFLAPKVNLGGQNRSRGAQKRGDLRGRPSAQEDAARSRYHAGLPQPLRGPARRPLRGDPRGDLRGNPRGDPRGDLRGDLRETLRYILLHSCPRAYPLHVKGFEARLQARQGLPCMACREVMLLPIFCVPLSLTLPKVCQK